MRKVKKPIPAQGDVMETISKIFDSISWFITDMIKGFPQLQDITGSAEHAYTTVARWIFIILSIFILIKSIVSLLVTKNPSEVWAYFNVNGKMSYPVTHWENVIGRSASADLQVDDPAVSRNQGILTRNHDGKWKFTDLGSKNGSAINGVTMAKGDSLWLEVGDRISMGQSICSLMPVSLEEQRNNMVMREQDTLWTSPVSSLIALTVFQLMTVLQLKISLGDDFSKEITMSFIGMAVLMWLYIGIQRLAERKGFEMEIIAFYLSTLSLSVTASKFPGTIFKQFIAIVCGFVMFIFMSSILSNLERAKSLRKLMYVGAALMFIVNLGFGFTKFGAANWIRIGGITFQPSEIIKLAYIWAGAACLDELMEKRNSLIFTIFSFFCFGCLAIMGDFGTALIFFVTFVVISFLRSGDFTKLILIVGVAGVGGLMVLKFKSHVAARFSVWGHVWDPEFVDGKGFQQTRTMSAAADGGLVGVGAGGGWLKKIPASETDLVFGFITEEWGLIIAVLMVLSIVTLSVFAVRSIWAGRSTFYTIAACSAMSLFLFQTMLNVFGSVDLFPLTGVTFPFVSVGGTSMISSWGMLSFLKAADTRQNGSFAVKLKSIETI